MGDPLGDAVARMSAGDTRREMAAIGGRYDDLAHATRRMLQALDAYWLHFEGYHGRGDPRSPSTEEDWWNRFERYRERVEAILKA